MFLQVEWNSGAMVVLGALFLLPVLLAYFIIFKILQAFPNSSAFLNKVKSKGVVVYSLFHLLLFGICGLILFLIVNNADSH
jgi:hypothetical protein